MADADVKPGYTTSEFWSTVLVHALSIVTMVLTTLHVNWSHLGAAEAAVPTVALVVSGLAQLMYANKRTELKVAQIGAAAAAYVPVLTSVAHNVSELAPVISAASPQAAKVIAEVEKVVMDVPSPGVVYPSYVPDRTEPIATGLAQSDKVLGTGVEGAV